MKFHSEGNLFLYGPGAGMSGNPRRVIQLGSDEVIYDDNEISGDLAHNVTTDNKLKTLPSVQIHRLVPSRQAVITNVAEEKLRYWSFLFYFLAMFTFQKYNRYYFNRSTRQYNEPLDYEAMRKLSRKNFSEETLKKVTWVHHMYSQWRIYRNGHGNEEFIYCDLDDPETITEENLVFGVSQFIREIRKVNGDQFPTRTLYKICMCVQFHLESVGYMWQLLSDARFVDLKFTLDNTMKERCGQNIGGPMKKALSHVGIDIPWENGFLGEDNPNQLLTTVF